MAACKQITRKELRPYRPYS